MIVGGGARQGGGDDRVNQEADEARMLSVTFCRLLLGGGVVVVGAMSSSFEILSEEGFAFEGSE